jgi:integrase
MPLLSDTAIKSLKPREKAYKKGDQKGMFLLIQPNGNKYFRLKYYFAGKEKLLALGVYPETSLKQAREKRDIARKQIADGIDPSEHRKATKAARVQDVENSFEVIAREWGSKQVENWDDKSNRNKRMLEKNIFPWLGHRPITDILPIEILTCLRRIEERGAIETAHRTLQICGQVFRYAVATARIDRDITADLRGALQTTKGGHFASITDPKELAPLLRAIDNYSGTFTVKAALQLAPLVFVRPSELSKMQWGEIDFNTREWRYTVTKTDTPHVVPLSTQAIAILNAIKPVTGHGRYVFPSARTPNGSRAMTSEALLAGLRRMGFDKTEMTTHGFRATARTILDEVLGVRQDFIEHQLAHEVKDPNGRSYNRTAHLPERHKMMQRWADYLEELKHGG